MGRPAGGSVACVVAVAAVSLFAGSIGAGRAPAQGAAEGVEWGGTVHADRESLEGWLRARGATYEVWAERHAVAAARLEQGVETQPAVSEPDQEEEQEEEEEATAGALPSAAIPTQEPTGLTPLELGLLVGLAAGIALLAAGALLASPRTPAILPPAVAGPAGGAAVVVEAAGIGLLLVVLVAFLWLA